MAQDDGKLKRTNDESTPFIEACDSAALKHGAGAASIRETGGNLEQVFAVVQKLRYFCPRAGGSRPRLMLSRYNFLCRSALVLTAVLSAVCCQLDAAENEGLDVPVEKTSHWENTFNLKKWAGYKDNVLFSHLQAVESPFVAGGLDALLWRLPDNGWEYLILGSGEYIRYLPGEQVDKEALALVQAQVRKSFGHQWRAGLAAEYLYFNQVFDNSLFDREFSSIQVEGHSMTLRPSLRWETDPGPFVEVEGFVTREIFKSIIDDEWQAGPKLTLGRTYGNRSEISVGYQLTDRQFDTREPRSAQGDLIPGRSLEFQQHEIFALWRHHWDRRRRWRTVTRLSLQRNDDNDGGYYDYFRPRISQQIRYAASGWQVRAEAKLTYYRYDIQTVSFDDPALRRKTFVQANIRGEKNVFKSLKCFVEYEYERSLSNLSVDDYRANTVSGGMDWEF